VPPCCPRCAGSLNPPDAGHDQWRCDLHGAVRPLYVSMRLDKEALAVACAHAEVPVWAPRPLPEDWMFTGLAYAGDEETGWRATALACAGPAPLGGLAEMVLVAEEPGIGLGAHLAGLVGPDAGEITGAASAEVRASGHEAPLWTVPVGDDRCAFVGEAAGTWLWAILWPPDAGYVFAEQVMIDDLRNRPLGPITQFGALSPHLRP